LALHLRFVCFYAFRRGEGKATAGASGIRAGHRAITRNAGERFTRGRGISRRARVAKRAKAAQVLTHRRKAGLQSTRSFPL